MDSLDWNPGKDPEEEWKNEEIYSTLNEVGDIFSSSHRWGTGAVKWYIERVEEEYGNIPNSNRVSVLISDADTTATEDPEFERTVMERIDDEDIEQMERNLAEFAGSEDFRKLAVKDTIPSERTDIGEATKYLFEEVWRLEPCIEEVLGEPHYVLGIEDETEFMNDLESNTTRMFNQGVIGRIQIDENCSDIYIRKDTLNDYMTVSENPYAP